MAWTLEKCYVLKVANGAKKIAIPNSEIKEEAGVVFVRISTQKSWIHSFTWSSKKKDVFDKIKAVRDEWFTEFENSKKDEIKSSRAKTKKVAPLLKLSLPTVVEIDAPTIGTVQSVKMRVMPSWNKSASLYIELNESNLAYLKDACHYQATHMQLKRVKLSTNSTPQQHGDESESAIDDVAEDDDNNECSSSAEVDIDTDSLGQLDASEINTPTKHDEIGSPTHFLSPMGADAVKSSPPNKRTLHAFFPSTAK